MNSDQNPGAPAHETPEHFEHVTKYFYEPGVAVSKSAVPGLREIQPLAKLSVDTKEEFLAVERLVASLTCAPHEVSLEEKCAKLNAQRGIGG
mgnify:CR=1 FL=1